MLWNTKGPISKCVKISGPLFGSILEFVSLRCWKLGRIRGGLPGLWLIPRYIMDFSAPQSFIVIPEGVLVIKTLLWNLTSPPSLAICSCDPNNPTNIYACLTHLINFLSTYLVMRQKSPIVQSHLQWLVVFQNLIVLWQAGSMVMPPQNNSPSICLV